MQRPTLSTFRLQFPTEAMGICQADPRVVSYCNESQERLLMDPMTPDEGWWGSSVTLSLTATVSGGAAYVTTPREIARLIVLSVCQQPVNIRNGFYEYLKFGAGLQPKTCTSDTCGQEFQAFERDPVVVLGSLLSTPQIIRIYPSDARDAAKRVLLQGKDNNSETVLTTDPNTGLTAPGEYITIAFPFVDSLNQFSVINGSQKDQTYGPIQFYQVDPTTGVETALSSMEPNEGIANYRRYLINGITATNLCCNGGTTLQIMAQGRLDYIPAQNETDYLIIQNVPALIEEAQSIRYGRVDNGYQQSLAHHARALSLLNGQLDLYCGKTSASIKMPIFGSNKMTRQPV